MRRGADVAEPRNWGAVIDRAVEGPPHEELVDAAEAPVGIAADQIDVEGFKVRR